MLLHAAADFGLCCIMSEKSQRVWDPATPICLGRRPPIWGLAWSVGSRPARLLLSIAVDGCLPKLISSGSAKNKQRKIFDKFFEAKIRGNGSMYQTRLLPALRRHPRKNQVEARPIKRCKLQGAPPTPVPLAPEQPVRVKQSQGAKRFLKRRRAAEKRKAASTRPHFVVRHKAVQNSDLSF